MNNFKILSIIEAIYVIYFLNYFKTRYSIAHPLTLFDNKYIKHPIGVHNNPESMVCQFGKDGSWLIVIYLIIRMILYRKYGNFFYQFSKFALILIFILSLMNFNVVLYLVPFFILEIHLIRNKFKI
jgi:hypothetical protein